VKIRIHAVEPRSRANGPGVRHVVWFQGCTLGCAGCFNPGTHATAAGAERLIEDMVAEIAEDVEGVSLSGGEPMQQPEAALALLRGARARGKSTLAFSGYTLDEISGLELGREILSELDVLIDGRYVAGERVGSGLRGSANQQIRLLTRRYSLADVEATPVAEIRISPTGELVLTGVDPVKVKQLL
jgi:anaerobic ribonucleoside-triphosphate reductase activating protein